MRDPRNGVILALAVASAFLGGALLGRVEPAEAQQSPSSYAGGTVAMNQKMIAATGSVGSGMSVLWLIDTEKRRLLVYGTNSMGKSVELRAARNIEWDFRLEEYHDDSQYKAEDLARLADKQRKPDAKEEPAPAPAPGTPAPKEGTGPGTPPK